MTDTTRICMWCKNNQRPAHVVGATMFMALMVLLHQSYIRGNDPFTYSLLLRFSFTAHRKETPPSAHPALARLSPALRISSEVINPSQQAVMNVATCPPMQLEGGTEPAARLAISTKSTNGSKITHNGTGATERSRVNHGLEHENLAPEWNSRITPDDKVEKQIESGDDSKHLHNYGPSHFVTLFVTGPQCVGFDVGFCTHL